MFRTFFRRAIFLVLILAVPIAIGIAAAHQTEDLPGLGVDAWLAVGAGLVLIAVVIAVLLWVQLRER